MVSRGDLHAVLRFERGRALTVCGLKARMVRIGGRWYQREPLYPSNREPVTCRRCLRIGGPGVHTASHDVVWAHVAEQRAAARRENR